MFILIYELLKYHLFAAIPLGQHDHGAPGRLELVNIAVHPPCSGRPERSTRITLQQINTFVSFYVTTSPK